MNKTYQILMTVLIATVAITAQIPNNGLVAWFPFNGTYNDESDNALTVDTLFSPVLTKDRNGTANSAYQLNGYHQGFKVVNTERLPKGNSDITITAWFFINSFERLNALVSWGADTLGKKNRNEISFYLSKAPNYDRILCLTNGTDSISVLCPINSTNTWFYAAVKISSGTATFYMNGEPTTPQKITFDIKAGGILGLGTDLKTESYHTSGFGGYLDDITIYNRALTDDEIKYIKTCNPSRNLAPSITSTAVTKGKATVVYSYIITTSDPENQNVTVSVPVKPSGMFFSGNKLTWTPTAAQVGTPQAVSIIAKDITGDSTTQKFNIVVEASTSISYKVTSIQTIVSNPAEKFYLPNGRLYQKNISGIALSKNHSRLIIK